MNKPLFFEYSRVYDHIMDFAATFFAALPRPRTRRFACVMLLTYLAVLLQPCAMAMGSILEQHGDFCQRDPAPTETVACMSQPSLDCVTDDLITDGRDQCKPLFDAPIATLVSDLVSDLPADLNARSAYFGRAPPASEPPLTLRHCVFLK